MAKNPQIAALNELGQSVWYDNLSRSVLNSGELRSLIDAGVSGLTSNPTIFKVAIADSNDYDAELKELARGGASSELLCEELMLKDVGAAADLLSAVYKTSGGTDGHASIEVSPFLAHDTEGTIEAARRLWKKLNRPNGMIKIPATPEGLPAIRQALEEGININITLIFSDEVYAKVAEAYIAALETRVARNQPVADIASVASFFVSRVDAICEKSFGELAKAGKAREADGEAIIGKVGIANSKIAYAKFEEIFDSPRFKKLGERGAHVQRPLWASTGTKNPKFSPVMYVEELAGRNTVNTMPPATLKALMQGGVIAPRLHEGLDRAEEIVASAERLGVPFTQLLQELQTAGVKLFADSFRELLDSIEKKKRAIA